MHQKRPSIGNHIYGAFGRDFGTSDAQRFTVAAISAGQWSALDKLDTERAAMPLNAETIRQFQWLRMFGKHGAITGQYQ